MKKLFLVFIILFINVYQIWSQNTPECFENAPVENQNSSYDFWASLGIGSNYFGLTFKSNLSYNYRNNLFTIRYFEAEEFIFSGAEDVFDEPTIYIKEIGFLYGRTMQKDILVLGLAAGIGYVDGVLRGDKIGYREYESIKISDISIPVELNFRFELSKYFGLGGSVFSNFNKEKSIVGGAIELQIGKLY